MNSLLSCLQAVASTVQRVEHENRLVNQYTARDFTPFRFMPWSEVPSTHMLAYFLDPEENHGQGALFQDIFFEHLRKLPLTGPRLPRSKWHVKAERRQGDFGQIDLLLTTANRSFAICLENKPRNQTIDQYRQLTRYRQFLRKTYGNRYAVLYLSSTPRRPHPDSLRPGLRWHMKHTGHYANITYEAFVLPLLDAWRQAVHPETLRSFLQHFRYQIEQWLNFSTTKPAQLMQAEEIVRTLISSSGHVRVAFDIQNSIVLLKSQLLKKLVQELVSVVPGASGDEHWHQQWKGFLIGEDIRPYSLRRAIVGPIPTCWPWGRFSISFEFEGGRLFYGIRFDRERWHANDLAATTCPIDAAHEFAILVAAEPGDRTTEWWPWWRWAGPITEQELYSSIADGSLIEELKREVQRLATVLDQFSRLPVAGNKY